MIEDERADERAGAVAARGEHRRQRFAVRGERADAVVAHPVMQRQEAGHQ